ncbi:exodeoxyribonuclease VII large subunit [Oceanospirillum linum]|uniref:exodeoxyribonuclease VII large subunit n=1 Tax=Oceanospirillum linum TaxID=966 RepID=UPI00089E5F69|nr:exodeoxyribonuclease VII large subunit [Oceanospirillum linum]SEG00848.1 Exodeoxyribonuclease VII large subunit [Oleiphilus messinensis]SMP21998.1 Exodeoxyribonuclease VII large subunit [Oceanospirillum linum]
MPDQPPANFTHGQDEIFKQPATPAIPERKVLTVSQLNRQARQLLEKQFALIVVEGEISNLSTPGSGHLYFSLKDEKSQVRCAMFRNRAGLLAFRPKNGDKVQLHAKVSLYEGRGDFQLIAETMEEQGRGALIRAFEALKFKLKEEGLFDRSRKKPLPPIPNVIGLITSPTGAAIRDMLIVLKRRFPLAEIVVYPATVQGNEAPDTITRAIELAHLHGKSDLLIIGRGGGSLEDLQAFNDERVARAISASYIPTVSAVGHETDITIADYIADYRAPTPSAAAEQVSPDLTQWQQWLTQSEATLHRQIERQLQNNQQGLDHLAHRYQRCLGGLQQQRKQLTHIEQRLIQGMKNQLSRKQQQLDKNSGRLKHPKTELHQQQQQLNNLKQQLLRTHEYQSRHHHQQLQQLQNRLWRAAPAKGIQNQQSQLHKLSLSLQKAWQHQLEGRQQKLAELSHRLQTVSPLATLSRGYAIVQDDKGNIVRHYQDVNQGDHVCARLATGVLHCKVMAQDADN